VDFVVVRGLEDERTPIETVDVDVIRLPGARNIEIVPNGVAVDFHAERSVGSVADVVVSMKAHRDHGPVLERYPQAALRTLAAANAGLRVGITHPVGIRAAHLLSGCDE